MRKFFLFLLLCVVFVSCESGKKNADLSFLNGKKKVLIPEENIVVIKTDFGEISIKLLPHESPESVNLFKKLCANGFYIGTSFHRVIPDTLIQGGDPLSKDGDLYNDGQGGYEESVPLEKNDLTMKSGAVALAHTDVDNRGSSQFFITIRNLPELNGKYTIIGYVVDGMDVVKRISHLKCGSGVLKEHPLEKVKIEEIKFLRDWKKKK